MLEAATSPHKMWTRRPSDRLVWNDGHGGLRHGKRKWFCGREGFGKGLRHALHRRRLCGLHDGWRRTCHHGSDKLAHWSKHARWTVKVWERIWGDSIRTHRCVAGERAILDRTLRRLPIRVCESSGRWGRLGPLFYDGRKECIALRDGLSVNRGPLTRRFNGRTRVDVIRTAGGPGPMTPYATWCASRLTTLWRSQRSRNPRLARAA